MSTRKRGRIQLEELVIGNSKTFQNKIGQLIEMLVVNSNLKYRIRREDNSENIVGKTAVKRHEMTEPIRQIHMAQEEIMADNISESSDDLEEKNNESIEERNRIDRENDGDELER